MLSFSQLREEVIRFKNVSSREGLSNDWVNAIAEDERGFLWLATRSGLNCYDGYEFENFYHNPLDSSTISTNDVSSLVCFNGVIYAGTWGGGLNVIDPVTKKITRLSTADSTLNYLTIKNMVVGMDSSIYIVTYGDGNYRFYPEKNQFVKLLPKEELDEHLFDYNEAVHCFKNQIWIGLITEGFGRVNSEGKLEHIKVDTSEFGSIKRVTVISDDGENLLIGTQSGELFKVDPITFIIKSKLSLKVDESLITRVTSILTDINNMTWISTSSGLYVVNKNTSELMKIVSSKESVSHNNEFCSFLDSRGVIWFGTWGSGLNKYDFHSFKFKEINLSNFKSSNTIKAVFELNDTTLLLGSSYGVLKHDKKWNVTTRPKITGKLARNLSENVILGFAKYKNKVLVAVDAAGLYTIDENFKTEKFKSLDNVLNYTFINNLYTTRDGDIWVPTWSKGLLHIDHETNELSHYIFDSENKQSISSNLVHSVFMDSDSIYWVGTKEGLCKFNKKEKTFERVQLSIPTPQKIKPLKDIRSIAEDKDGYLWISSSVGLVKWNKDNDDHLLLFTEENGLIDHVFLGIQIIENNLWGGTKAGLVRLNIKNYSVDNYTVKDGLLSNSFVENSINLTSDSILYLGNGNGMVYLDATSHRKFQPENKLFITRLCLNREEIYESDVHISHVRDVVVPHNKNSLLFKIQAQNFGSDKEYLFAHKLKGFKDEWILHKLGQDEISYTNLATGEYELILSNVNFEGALVGEKTYVKIKVLKPFWLSWWSILLSFSFIVMLIYWLFQWRSKTIRSNNAILEKKVRGRTSQLMNQNEKLKKAYKSLKVKDQDLLENIKYASILQNSLQLNDFDFARSFGSHFIFHEYKGHVTGDFYWSIKVESKRIIVCGDCTGHGVSGAFLSVIGITSLRTITLSKGILRPDYILDELHQEVSQILNQSDNSVSDGMDISIICYDEETKVLEIASAMSSPLIVNNKGEYLRIRGNRFPVGGDPLLYKSKRKKFDRIKLELDGRYMIYLFTDGYQNQFGGAHNKKFMQPKLRELLLQHYFKSPSNQKKILETTFNKWKGDNPQTDDVLIIGLELNNK